jgi:hypothetical protein
MIRRTFIKALCASPLGYLIRKFTCGAEKTETCHVMGCELPTVDDADCWCLRHTHYLSALIAGQRRTNDLRKYFTVWKDGKVIDRFKL